ncbi:hypothetical protein A8C56_17035 [Niabella ginsenosidivorans]|uniref:Uncharacterized protein n=1 Tax=Niabella ginsenosidivorans TaxID=1176587 RepID=A0A1A9I7C9_9BACT|nr:hypothetical protein [Niabella ginsenosidivorans]ANH82444.1 hypothetical protein A8C56_17035 [Niabella ginsenosidivorans]
MKRVLFIAFSLLLMLQLQAQSQFFRVVKDYFRVDPFTGKFSDFVETVKTDPELTNIEFSPKTDTSLFSIKGDYKTFNPFTVKARGVQMSLSEKKTLVRESPQAFDTIMLYMITGFFDSTRQTYQMVQKEYKKINTKIKRDLPAHGTASLVKLSGLKDGQITNHAVSSTMASPISVAWYLTEDNELALMVVLRMKYENNRAYPGGMLFDYFYLRQGE